MRTSTFSPTLASIKKMKRTSILIILSCFIFSFNSCSSWVEFNVKRLLFVFFFTLALGVLGLIISFFSNKNK